MSIDPTLMRAILSMDAYNRNYNVGVEGLTGNQIGNYSIINNSSDLFQNADKAIGFYAAAYQSGSETIISYRGTDQFFPGSGIGGDATNGYGIASGYPDGPQAQMAINFCAFTPLAPAKP